jgi:predicted GNAT family N-acyltransferase
VNDNITNITVKLVETEEDMEAAVSIRFRVFVDEQSVPPEIELDEYDAVATHAIAVEDGQAIGAGRMYLEGGAARIGRMAVDLPHRRRGVGGLLLRFLEEEAIAQGATEIILHAQDYVKAFYASHGYTEHGDTFMEAGILHVEMRKRA